jgi:hypothetical protein
MRIAILGTRGSRRYGGFETFAEEFPPLAARGHQLTVYVAPLSGDSGACARHLPSIRHKYLDTLSIPSSRTLLAARE